MEIFQELQFSLLMKQLDISSTGLTGAEPDFLTEQVKMIFDLEDLFL